MAKSVSTNYSRVKSHYGGIPGTIQQHAMEGIILDKDPSHAFFKENLPAGFLPCNGMVKNVKDYYCLAQALGIGDECRFKKDHVTLRNPDADTDDLGSFQLPDLGSKVLLGGRATGELRGTTVGNTNTNRVGVQVDPYSNMGDRINVNYTGYLTATAQAGINFNGNVKYNMDRKTSQFTLSIEHFQGHAHEIKNLAVLNYTGAHATSGVGKGNAPNAANAGAGNELDETQLNIPTGDAWHDHTITRPTSYTPDPFTYGFNSFQIPLDDMYSYIDVDVEDLNVLNQVVTPFIFVHYIIKF